MLGLEYKVCLVLLLGTHFSAQNQGDGSEECTLPEEWRGEYFKSGQRDSFFVTTQTFGTEGSCYRKHEDGTFLLFSREEKCYKCLQVWVRHVNALEYKLGECKRFESPTDTDCQILTESEYSTLVRMTAENTPCPFHGHFTFSYKEAGKECSTPPSYLSECVDKGQAYIRFGVCSDALQTEADGNVFYQTIISIKGDPEETLSCKATWLREDDPTETYMIGTLDYRYKRTEEERYRCFLVKETKRGIQVSQSLNSSCYSELHSSTAGHRTLRLVREEEKTNLTCVYPNWASEMETLYSFGFSSKYEFQFGGSILSASNYSSTTNRSFELSRTRCVSIVEEDEGYVKLVAKTVAGCDQMYKCVRLFRRTDNIIEIQEGSPTIHESYACDIVNFDEKRTIYTTLFREELNHVICPINGLHNVTGIYILGNTEQCEGQGFSHLNIRCGDEEHFIQVYQECPSEDGLRMEQRPKRNYICLGGWETVIPAHELIHTNFRNTYQQYSTLEESSLFVEDDDTSEIGNITLGYVVATQDQVPEKRICFMYTKHNDEYSWTVDQTACLRNIRPGIEGRRRFNTTKLETCRATYLTFQTWSLLSIYLLYL